MTNNEIINYVCNRFFVDKEDLTSSSRKAIFSEPRMLCMLLIRQINNDSLQVIGDIFNRDHATVIHALRTINNSIELYKTTHVFKVYSEVIKLNSRYTINENVYCNECTY